MRLGIDAMGGDYAPKAAVEGALDAAKILPLGTTLVLFGDTVKIEEIITAKGEAIPSNIEIVHTSQVIGMDESPAQAFSSKPDSSIVMGFTCLKMGKIDAFASAGSTGAMMAGCMLIIKQIDGVIRPTIATALPTTSGTQALLLDVGLNVDCKPEVLYQYGTIGSIYSKEMLGIENPRVALLNIGEEESKGNIQTKATHTLMKGTTEFNFVGNVEPKTMFLGKEADVFVCDGFVGNLMLKQAESMYSALRKYDIENPLMEGLNYENAGGTPVLGVNKCVIIGHGCSTPKAICNMIFQTEKSVKAQLVEKIKAAFKSE